MKPVPATDPHLATSPRGQRVAYDEQRFRAWYDASLPRVYRYLFNRCGRNTDVAEELTQQTFVAALRAGGHLRNDPDPSWLVGVARNQLLHYFRGLERREHGFLRLVSPPAPVALWLTDADPEGRLSASVARLPAAQRAAIVLRYVDDLPVREVARLLDRTEKSVESLLSRGRATLRQSLAEDQE